MYRYNSPCSSLNDRSLNASISLSNSTRSKRTGVSEKTPPKISPDNQLLNISSSVKPVPVIQRARLENISDRISKLEIDGSSSNFHHRDSFYLSSSNSSLNSTKESPSKSQFIFYFQVQERNINVPNKTFNYRTDIKNILSSSNYGQNGTSSSNRKNSDSSSTTSFKVTSDDYSNRGLVGLKNLGNTCFMNSVLQCLSNTQELLKFCLENGYKSELNKNSSMKGNLFQSYADLMQELWSPNQSSFGDFVSPNSFRSQIQKFAPRFMGYLQQDAQEFLRYLLEGLHEDVNRVKIRPPVIVPNYDEEDKLDDLKKSDLFWDRYIKRDNSKIVDLFMGQLLSTLECTECGYRSTTFDPFWDLSLPIDRKSSIDILDCMNLFTSKEELGGMEKPMCGRCKQRRRCFKWFNIQRFPKILVLHLKRFSGERFKSKMTNLVTYPLDQLDLKEFASPTCMNKCASKYRLYSVSNHSGGCYGGHYTAYCRNPFNGDWYEYNDNRVRSIRETSVISSEGYILFYVKI